MSERNTRLSAVIKSGETNVIQMLPESGKYDSNTEFLAAPAIKIAAQAALREYLAKAVQLRGRRYENIADDPILAPLMSRIQLLQGGFHTGFAKWGEKNRKVVDAFIESLLMPPGSGVGSDGLLMELTAVAEPYYVGELEQYYLKLANVPIPKGKSYSEPQFEMYLRFQQDRISTLMKDPSSGVVTGLGNVFAYPETELDLEKLGGSQLAAYAFESCRLMY